MDNPRPNNLGEVYFATVLNVIGIFLLVRTTRFIRANPTLFPAKTHFELLTLVGIAFFLIERIVLLIDAPFAFGFVDPKSDYYPIIRDLIHLTSFWSSMTILCYVILAVTRIGNRKATTYGSPFALPVCSLSAFCAAVAVIYAIEEFRNVGTQATTPVKVKNQGIGFYLDAAVNSYGLAITHVISLCIALTTFKIYLPVIRTYKSGTPASILYWNFFYHGTSILFDIVTIILVFIQEISGKRLYLTGVFGYFNYILMVFAYVRYGLPYVPIEAEPSRELSWQSWEQSTTESSASINSGKTWVFPGTSKSERKGSRDTAISSMYFGGSDAGRSATLSLYSDAETAYTRSSGLPSEEGPNFVQLARERGSVSTTTDLRSTVFSDAHTDYTRSSDIPSEGVNFVQLARERASVATEVSTSYQPRRVRSARQQANSMWSAKTSMLFETRSSNAFSDGQSTLTRSSQSGLSVFNPNRDTVVKLYSHI